MAAEEKNKVDFRFPDIDVKTTKDKDQKTDIQVAPRVSFISYTWKSARPALEETKMEKAVKTSSTTLYLPAGFSEKYGADWGDEDIVTGLVDSSAIVASAAEAVDKMSGGFAGFISSIKYTEGQTVFPGQFMTFKRGKPIALDFTFDLIPRNRPEGDLIVKIVNNFKRKILPTVSKVGNQNALLSYPDVWHIIFSGAKSIGYPTTKNIYEDMALVSVNASYGGGAQSALTFYDGNPVSVNLSLSFASVKHSYILGD